MSYALKRLRNQKGFTLVEVTGSYRYPGGFSSHCCPTGGQ